MPARLRLGCVGVIASLAILISAVGTHASTVVTWNSSAHIIDGVPAQHVFDTAELFFSGFTANSLTAITGPGYYQNRGTLDRVFSMSVLLDGDWVEIYNSGKVPTISVLVLLSTLDTPMLFEPGVVTGLKLATVGDVSYAYQKMIGTQFTFDVAATPLPAALPLFGGGLAVMALLSWRRRRLLARRLVYQDRQRGSNVQSRTGC